MIKFFSFLFTTAIWFSVVGESTPTGKAVSNNDNSATKKSTSNASKSKTESFKSKKILENYAKAFSSLDLKAMNEIIASRLYTRYRNMFHDYRKNKIKPNLTLQYISEKRHKEYAQIRALASLQVNGRYRFHNVEALVDARNGIIMRMAISAKYIGFTDFWAAADNVGIFGIVSRNKDKTSKKHSIILHGMLDGSKPEFESIEGTSYLSSYMKANRQYIIPLVKLQKSYAFAGTSYPLPEYHQESAKLLLGYLVLARMCPPGKSLYMLKSVLGKTELSYTWRGVIKRIAEMGIFNQPLDEKNISFWTTQYDKKETDWALKNQLLSLFAIKNFKSFRQLFEAALKNENTTFAAAMVFARYDRKYLESKIWEFLKDNKTNILAVRNSRFMLRDQDFVNALMSTIKNMPDFKQLPLYMPILTASNNKIGNDYIMKLLSTEKDPRKKGFIVMSVCRSDNPVFGKYVLDFVKEKTEDKKKDLHYEYILKPMALSYLCGIENKEAIAIALKNLKSIKNDRNKIQRFFMAFRYNSNFRKINNVKELERYLEMNLSKLQ